MNNNKTTSNRNSEEAQSQMDPGLTRSSAELPENSILASQLQDGPSTGIGNLASGSSTNPRAGLPPGATLASIFRYHMGIENDSDLVPSHLAQKHAIDPIATGMNKGRRAVNLGIYNRVIREERGNLVQFHVWSVVINLALGLQIVFAAILTALGAGNGPHDVVAIFGALNTIIAGFLTYLKGTGLPMRVKYFYNQWLKLRAYIEQRERDFASDDHLTVHLYGYQELMEEIHVIEGMYQNIRKDIERHTPDSYSGSKGDGNDADAPGEGVSDSKLSKLGLNAFKSRMYSAGGPLVDQAKHGIEGRIKSTVEDVERRISGHLSSHLTKLQEHSQTKTQYGAVNPQKQSQDQVEEADPDLEANSESHDMSDMEITRMRQQQAQAQEAQRKAEMRIKELEQKLANKGNATSDQAQ